MVFSLPLMSANERKGFFLFSGSKTDHEKEISHFSGFTCCPPEKLISLSPGCIYLQRREVLSLKCGAYGARGKKTPPWPRAKHSKEKGFIFIEDGIFFDKWAFSLNMTLSVRPNCFSYSNIGLSRRRKVTSPCWWEEFWTSTDVNFWTFPALHCEKLLFFSHFPSQNSRLIIEIVDTEVSTWNYSLRPRIGTEIKSRTDRVGHTSKRQWCRLIVPGFNYFAICLYCLYNAFIFQRMLCLWKILSATMCTRRQQNQLRHLRYFASGRTVFQNPCVLCCMRLTSNNSDNFGITHRIVYWVLGPLEAT